MKIVCIEPLQIPAEKSAQYAETLFELGHEFIHYQQAPLDINTLKERVADANVIITASYPLPAEIIRECAQLQMIAVAFTGYDAIDLESCRERKIAICNVPEYASHAVAEQVLGMTITLLRKFKPMENQLRTGKNRGSFQGIELFGKKVGIIGTGRIGMEVAKIFMAFGCQILAYSPHPNEEALRVGVRYVSLETLLSQSDVVSLHAALNDDTRNMLGPDQFNLMKSTAILINTARGGLIQYEALADALKQFRIYGAGIDVFEIEPPLPENHPLFSCPNNILLPHTGYATKEALEKRADVVMENIRQWLQGNLQNQII